MIIYEILPDNIDRFKTIINGVEYIFINKR